MSQLSTYNRNLNDRLARKMDKYKSRDQQLDLVIVVDRLLTGFDAPCLSTLFIDRQPMNAHDIIQAFSRTNRIFEVEKKYGQIVTFQSPKKFKKAVDDAIKLFSAGGTGEIITKPWEEVEADFIIAMSELRDISPTPSVVPSMINRELKILVARFHHFDRLLAQLKSFTRFEEKGIEDYGMTDFEYEEYMGQYKNALERLKEDAPVITPPGPDDPPEPPVDIDYELLSYSRVKIDYDYIISLPALLGD